MKGMSWVRQLRQLHRATEQRTDLHLQLVSPADLEEDELRPSDELGLAHSWDHHHLLVLERVVHLRRYQRRLGVLVSMGKRKRKHH